MITDGFMQTDKFFIFFFTVKNHTDTFTTDSWQEIGGWSTNSEDGNTVFQTGTVFSSETGRFRSPLASSAVYLISASILIYHNNATSFEFQVRVDGSDDARDKLISIKRPALTSLTGKRLFTLSSIWHSKTSPARVTICPSSSKLVKILSGL